MGLIGESPVRDSTAVVLIDMQHIFFQELSWETQQTLLAAQTKLIIECAKYDIPLAVIQYSGFGSTIFQLQQLIRNVPRSEYYAKTSMNGFSGGWLEGFLDKHRVSTVLFAGIFASQCVFETANATPKKYHIGTSEVLIADHRFDQCMRETREWFADHGSFYPDYVSPRTLKAPPKDQDL
ncbi:MAG: isochorismatase family protein [Candidatus Paceibacterota bacterium]